MRENNTRELGVQEDAPKIESVTCDWLGCAIQARFHIEIPLNKIKHLAGDGALRMPFSRTHHNVCGAHLDEYSIMRSPKAIYAIGNCPHCDSPESR